MPNMKLTCIVRKEGKAYSAFCPELDVASQGRTPAKAKKNLQEALEGHIQVAQEEGMLDSLLARRAKVMTLKVLVPAR